MYRLQTPEKPGEAPARGIFFVQGDGPPLSGPIGAPFDPGVDALCHMRLR